MAQSPPPPLEGRVLSTLNEDGTRHKIRPRLVKGRFLRWRQILGYTLIAIFAVLPFIEINGRPFFLLNIPERKFFVFGGAFLATDTVVLMLFMVAIVIGIFLLTALWGRVWCGWACPQTIYMELIYRPIERLFEGTPTHQRRMDREGGGIRRMLKNATFFLVSFFFANIFVAYFIGGKTVVAAMTGSPSDHLTAFVTVLLVTVLMFIDFAWFREQTCIVACPYGRLQAVLLDRNSVIVGYDYNRGEPRARYRDRKRAEKAGEQTDFGDCVDCDLCVKCCPTGIDIRQGLQMECIGCTQCIDACDSVMDGFKKPRGLIRYTSSSELGGAKKKLLRARTVAYPALLFGLVSLLVFAIGQKADADIILLRGRGEPYKLIENKVSNHIRLKVVNRGSADEEYKITLAENPSKTKLIIPTNPLPVKEGKPAIATVFAMTPRKAFKDGQCIIKVKVSATKSKFVKVVAFKLLGPKAAQ
jgi:cytochrome c oxidase accessory protein FixG